MTKNCKTSQLTHTTKTIIYIIATSSIFTEPDDPLQKWYSVVRKVTVLQAELWGNCGQNIKKGSF